MFMRGDTQARVFTHTRALSHIKRLICQACRNYTKVMACVKEQLPQKGVIAKCAKNVIDDA